MLEDTRVAHCLSGLESNFRIFYLLRNSNDPRLDISGCTSLLATDRSIEDDLETADVVRDLELFFADAEVDTIFDVLGAILHLGEILRGDEFDLTHLKGDRHLRHAAELLGMDYTHLAVCLAGCFLPGTKTPVQARLDKSRIIRDSLITGLYTDLFDVSHLLLFS